MLLRRSPGLLLILLALFAPVLPCVPTVWEDSSPEVEAVAVSRPLPSRRDAGRALPREAPESFRTSSAPLSSLRPSARELTGRLNQ